MKLSETVRNGDRFLNRTENFHTVYGQRSKTFKIGFFANFNFFLGIEKRVNEYLTSIDNDADIFLPVQGQKRGSIKQNKKKSQSQCLQQ